MAGISIYFAAVYLSFQSQSGDVVPLVTASAIPRTPWGHLRDCCHLLTKVVFANVFDKSCHDCFDAASHDHFEIAFPLVSLSIVFAMTMLLGCLHEVSTIKLELPR